MVMLVRGCWVRVISSIWASLSENSSNRLRDAAISESLCCCESGSGLPFIISWLRSASKYSRWLASISGLYMVSSG